MNINGITKDFVKNVSNEFIDDMLSIVSLYDPTNAVKFSSKKKISKKCQVLENSLSMYENYLRCFVKHFVNKGMQLVDESQHIYNGGYECMPMKYKKHINWKAHSLRLMLSSKHIYYGESLFEFENFINVTNSALYLQELVCNNYFVWNERKNYKLNSDISLLYTNNTPDHFFDNIHANKLTLKISKNVTIPGNDNEINCLEIICSAEEVNVKIPMFSNVRNLVVIMQCDNCSIDFKNLVHMQQLKSITVSSANCGNIKLKNLFTNNENIKTLEEFTICNIDIKQIPVGIFNNVNIKYLCFDYCKNVSKIPEEVEKLANLEIISVSLTKIRSVPKKITKINKVRVKNGKLAIKIKNLNTNYNNHICTKYGVLMFILPICCAYIITCGGCCCLCTEDAHMTCCQVPQEFMSVICVPILTNKI